jgi:hypothetical protein
MTFRESLTEELIEEIAAHVEDGAHAVTAAGVCRVPRSCFERWHTLGTKLYDVDEAPDPDDVTDHEQLCYLLARRVAQAEAECEARWIGHWHRALLTERRSNAFTGWLALLERRFPERWAKRAPASVERASISPEEEFRRLYEGG